MGAASGQARAVQVEVLVWNGDRLQDRSRRWSFLDAALEELERAEAGADGG
jgi:hypothetical protein